MRSRSLAALGLVLSAAVIAGCGDSTPSGSTGPTSTVASVTVTLGAPTIVVGGSTQATAIAKDASGAVVTGATMTWSTSDGAKATVSTSGLVTGAGAGTVAILASTGGVSGGSSVIVSGAAAHLDIFSGNDQSARAGTALSAPIVVRVSDALGNPVPGASIAWSAGNGYGSAAPVTSTTGTDGLAQTTWTLGVGGASIATAALTGVRSVTFAATATVALTNAGTIAAGSDHTCALDAGAATYCWGANSVGSIGDGTLSPTRLSPTKVSTGALTFAALSAGNSSCALTPVGNPYCWGFNHWGELGDGSTVDRTTPVSVAGTNAYVQLAAGLNMTCALTSDLTPYCWGANGNDALGDGGTEQTEPLPTLVAGHLHFVQIGAGDNNTCGLTAAGAAYCWGIQRSLGSTASGDSPVPVAVAGNHVFTSIAVGESQACGLTASGQGFCWGTDGLGAGVFQSQTPVAVSGGHVFAHIYAGGVTCGLIADGTAYCWGNNGYGNAGDGTTTARLTPVAVSGNLAFAELSVGRFHTCGRTTDGSVYCWGSNTWGQLGDGTTTDRHVPTRITIP